MNRINSIKIENAKICNRNFSGAPTRWNPQGGTKTFSIEIDDPDYANQLNDIGWNVKTAPPVHEGDIPRYFLSVKVSYNQYGPNVYLKTVDASGASHIRPLNDQEIGMLDHLNCASVDLVVNPHVYSNPGEPTKISAYLGEMFFTQDTSDSFISKYIGEF